MTNRHGEHVMPGPSIVVYQVDGMHHVVSAPCGNSSTGMTATDDLPIQVRRALDHARNCGRCLGHPLIVCARCGQPLADDNCPDVCPCGVQGEDPR